MSGFAPLGRLISLAMISAGLGTSAVLATAETAQAAGPDSPTAIGVSSGGTSYVGFASGGKLLRLAPGGARKKAVSLDQDEAVDGLFVSNNDDIWVDYESSVSLLTPSGKVIQHFDHDPVRDCDNSAPPSRYGGITANGNRVYVANRCHASISVYTRGGSLEATVDLPGSSYPRGIAYGGPQAGRPATLYVALPDRGQILAYNATSLRSSSSPARTFNLDRPNGGNQPEPAGLAVDRYGQLVATDVANNALYFFDANNDFSLYRTLGHPPGASREAGRLNSASAVAQHDQDGSGLAGNLFVADTDNNRVQRWSTGGYTYWAKGVRAGASGGNDNDDDPDDPGGGNATIPVNTIPPEVAGDPEVGTTLTCYAGVWSGKPKSFDRAWLRGSEVISGATGTYTPVEFDQGKQISCRVRAKNAKGTSEWVTSEPVTIPGGSDEDPDTGDGPTNTTAPSITGTAAVGQVLTCGTGSWSGGNGGGPLGGGGGANTYAFTWQRDGTTIAGATTAAYTVVAADSGRALTCVVRATNSSGSTSATSAAVTVGGSGPVNTVLPAITGTPAVGQVLTCGQGTWTTTGATTYATAWKRNGAAIAGAAAATYTVVAADAGTALTCTVTATNAGGPTTATSSPVTVSSVPSNTPSNSVDPTISGTASVGQPLTCLPGTWTGSPFTYLYAWQRDGAPIDGATTATYTPVAADLGRSIACLVVAVNGYGAGSETTAPVVVSAALCPGVRTGVSINAGADQVVGNAVTLSIRPPAGAVTMTVSNDGGFAGASTVTVPVACSMSWALGAGTGTRYVYVQFDSSQAPPYSDNIDVVSARPVLRY